MLHASSSVYCVSVFRKSGYKELKASHMVSGKSGTALAQVNTDLVTTHQDQVERGSSRDARGRTNCAVSVPHLLGGGTLRKTSKTDVEIRHSENNTN